MVSTKNYCCLDSDRYYNGLSSDRMYIVVALVISSPMITFAFNLKLNCVTISNKDNFILKLDYTDYIDSSN